MQNYYNNKKILITGGLGFLGSNLAHKLVEYNAKVKIIDSMLPLYGGNLFNVEDIKDKILIEYTDIRDEEKMNNVVKNIDIIFHIAGQTSHIDSMQTPLLDVDINCKGNIILLEACRKFNPDVKIIYAGTRAQYGAQKHFPVSENQSVNPVDIYGANKNVAEQYHIIYYRVYGLRTVCLRISNTYGPRHQMKHNRYGILNWFIRLALDNEKIKIYGDGRQKRDYNYVDDVSSAFLIAGMEDKAIGKIYNLGSKKPIELRKTVEMITSIAKSGSYEFVEWESSRKKIETGDYYADIKRIEKELGWKPKISLEEGLKKTIEYYRKYRKYYWG